MDIKYKACDYSTFIEPEDDDGSVFLEEKGAIRNISPGDIVRVCGISENAMFEASKYKQCNTVMQLWLSSKKPIEKKKLIEALFLVSRQVPQLQFCHSKRNGKLWFKRMPKTEIDFDTSEKSQMELLHEMLDTTYDFWNGPLWKVRLNRTPKLSENDDKYSAVLTFSILHTINDGVTNMKIARDFTSAMNLLTAGKNITPIYVPIIPPADKIAREASSLGFIVKKSIGNFYSTIVKKNKFATAFSDCLPPPQSTEAKTKVLIDNFSKIETENISKICKKEMVSINTFIITVANFALLSISKSKVTDVRKIVVAQAVNLRRHFEPQNWDAPGCHAAVFEDTCHLSLADMDKFWSIARSNNLTFKKQLENKLEYLKMLPILKFAVSSILQMNNFLTKNGYRTIMPVQYGTSNMGNLNKLLPEPNENDDMEITYVIRSISHHLFGNIFLLNYQTLRGKLILSMDYFTNQMSDDIAEEYFTLLYKLIRNKINLIEPPPGEDSSNDFGNSNYVKAINK